MSDFKKTVNPWLDSGRLNAMKTALALPHKWEELPPPPESASADQGAQAASGYIQKTRPEELVYCYATTTSGLRVVGISKSIGYNIGCLDNWARGNLRNAPRVSARDARAFFGAVLYAHQEAWNPDSEEHEGGPLTGKRKFTGRRSAFHCAEVNAVTLLLGEGASLREIQIYWPYQKSSVRHGSIDYCAACQIWIRNLGIHVIDSI